MKVNKPRLALIKSGCQFIAGPVVDMNRWQERGVREFCGRLIGMINDQLDGKPDPFTENTPEQVNEIFKEDDEKNE